MFDKNNMASMVIINSVLMVFQSYYYTFRFKVSLKKFNKSLIINKVKKTRYMV